MIRHTQTLLHVSGVSVGDCWRTAIACLLDVPSPLEVPHFVGAHPDSLGEHPETDTRWWDETVAWVEGQWPGWTIGSYEPKFPLYADPDNAPDYVILGGASPRGIPHVVIADARTGEVVWDPHPDRTGLAGEPDCVYALVSVGER